MIYRYSFLFGLLFFSISIFAASGVSQKAEKTVGNTGRAIAQQPHDAHLNISAVPDLMTLVMGNIDALKLTEIQQRDLKFWRDHEGSDTKVLAKKISTLEKDLHHAVLAGKSTGYLSSQANRLLSTRLQLTSQRILAIDNMRHILTAQQWQKLVKLARENAL